MGDSYFKTNLVFFTKSTCFFCTTKLFFSAAASCRYLLVAAYLLLLLTCFAYTACCRCCCHWEMQFNLMKCPVLATYTIGKNVIQKVNYIKYLGVTIDSQLNWNEHIKAIAQKANATKSFLHGCIITSFPTKVKLNCYKSLVRPVLKYASIVWAPHTISGITSVEKVQRFSARFICNDYSIKIL